MALTSGLRSITCVVVKAPKNNRKSQEDEILERRGNNTLCNSPPDWMRFEILVEACLEESKMGEVREKHGGKYVEGNVRNGE